MKRILLTLLLVPALCSGHASALSSEQGTDNDTLRNRQGVPAVRLIPGTRDTKHTAKHIRTRLELMYAIVFNSITTDTPSLSDYFFSEQFRTLCRTAEHLTPEGETGYYDFDPWLRSQDFKDPKAEIGNIGNIGGKTATAVVIVYPFGKKEKGIPVNVSLRFERDEWFISNFDNDVEGLQQYIDQIR